MAQIQKLADEFNSIEKQHKLLMPKLKILKENHKHMTEVINDQQAILQRYKDKLPGQEKTKRTKLMLQIYEKHNVIKRLKNTQKEYKNKSDIIVKENITLSKRYNEIANNIEKLCNSLGKLK